MIVSVPATTPLTTPESDPMVATDGLLLVQMPPVTQSVSVAGLLTQTGGTAGMGQTVFVTATRNVAAQPVTGSV